jgi:hypothetical protein
MDTHHVPDKYVQENDIVIDDFNRYWIAYKWCAIRGDKFKCGCGAILKPSWDKSEEYIDKTNISMVACAFHKHIDTPKHKNSLAVQIKFLEHLETRFKKDVFYDEHENFEKERYDEFQEYEREHRAFLLKRRQQDGFKRWLRKQEERIAREEAEELDRKNREAMRDFIRKTD